MEVAILDCRYYFTADSWKRRLLKDNNSCFGTYFSYIMVSQDVGHLPGLNFLLFFFVFLN